MSITLGRLELLWQIIIEGHKAHYSQKNNFMIPIGILLPIIVS